MAQNSLQEFMDMYKAVLATYASIPCDPAATSYVPVNVLGDGALFPLIEPGMNTEGRCLKFTMHFGSDLGCYILDFSNKRMDEAVKCCAGDCQSRPECILLSRGYMYWIPGCGGDKEPPSFNPMPAGFTMPPSSGPTCGGGDGKGNWGWGSWSS